MLDPNVGPQFRPGRSMGVSWGDKVLSGEDLRANGHPSGTFGCSPRASRIVSKRHWFVFHFRALRSLWGAPRQPRGVLEGSSLASTSLKGRGSADILVFCKRLKRINDRWPFGGGGSTAGDPKVPCVTFLRDCSSEREPDAHCNVVRSIFQTEAIFAPKSLLSEKDILFFGPPLPDATQFAWYCTER